MTDAAVHSPLQKIVSWTVERRVNITSAVFILLAGENILRGLHPHNLANLRDVKSILGLALVVLGLSLRSWAAGTVHKCSVLATSGPYALIRNPLYAGSFILMAGFCTLIDRYEDWLLLLPLGLVFLYSARREERWLADRFGGAWHAYARRTPRFIPRRLSAELAHGWTLRQWFHNREYQALAAALLGLLALQTWHIMGYAAQR
jgi:protein-S-isoprenylcysteine O-methyltransferase Ste14